MNNRKFIIGLIVLFIVLLLIQYTAPVPINWSPTLSSSDKIPFGTYVLYDRLQDIFPSQEIKKQGKSLYEAVHIDGLNQDANYIVIAKSFDPSESDMNAVLTYANQGGNVFIAASTFGSKFEDTLKFNIGANFYLGYVNLDTSLRFMDTTRQYISFTNEHLPGGKKQYAFKGGVINSHLTEIDTASTVVLAYNQVEEPVMIRIPYGRGNFYINTLPLTFTNYFMLDSNNAEYVANTFSYLPVKPVMWDEYYKPFAQVSHTPLRFILGNDALRWAYYIMIGSLVLFIIFEAKRKQRVIPVVKPPQNTSLEFVETIGSLYYQYRDHLNLANKKIMFFLEHIRNTYFLKTNLLDDDFIKALSEKSGVEEMEVKRLISLIKKIELRERISESELLQLTNQIENFRNKTNT